MESFQPVIDFWFSELSPPQWWKKSSDLDDIIARKFAGLHGAASCGELYPWRAQALGRLAEIIVLDQFSRNMHRNSAQAFATDNLALILAQHAVALKVQQGFSLDQKAFLYMPFMHSESSLIHEQAVKLYNEPELESNLKFELRHKEIIDRFGRYPHRNAILGRTSSPEEIEFLKQPGSSF